MPFSAIMSFFFPTFNSTSTEPVFVPQAVSGVEVSENKVSTPTAPVNIPIPFQMKKINVPQVQNTQVPNLPIMQKNIVIPSGEVQTIQGKVEPNSRVQVNMPGSNSSSVEMRCVNNDCTMYVSNDPALNAQKRVQIETDIRNRINNELRNIQF